MTTPDGDDVIVNLEGLVLNLEDLPTLRLLAKMTRLVANKYVPTDDTDPNGLLGMCKRYTARFIENLVAEMERQMAENMIIGIPE